MSQPSHDRNPPPAADRDRQGQPPSSSPEADTPQPSQPGPAGAETDSGDQTTEAGR